MDKSLLSFVIPSTQEFKIKIADHISQLASKASIVGIGEMTHGSREIFLWRQCVLKQLVEREGFRTIVFESGAVSTTALDRYVRFGNGSAEEALAKTGFWSMANMETLGFVRWLRAFNKELPEKSRVHVYGCDVQSLDALVALVKGLVPVSDQPKSLGTLPTDADLFANIEKILSVDDVEYYPFYD